MIDERETNRANFLKRRCEQFLVKDFFAHFLQNRGNGLNCLFGLKSFFLVFDFFDIKQVGFCFEFGVKVSGALVLVVFESVSFLKILFGFFVDGLWFDSESAGLRNGYLRIFFFLLSW